VEDRAHLSSAQVVKCSSRYLAFSEKMRLCSIGVYAAVAPFWRHNMRKASSDCGTWRQRHENVSPSHAFCTWECRA